MYLHSSTVAALNHCGSSSLSLLTHCPNGSLACIAFTNLQAALQMRQPLISKVQQHQKDIQRELVEDELYGGELCDVTYVRKQLSVDMRAGHTHCV